MSARGSFADPGQPGTARWRRVWELQGITQREIGAACKPKLTQAAINQFERGVSRMTWKLAARLAAAYYPKLWHSGKIDQQHQAKAAVWRLWFANVAAHGSPEMQNFAAQFKTQIEQSIFEPLPLFAAAARNEAPAQILTFVKPGEERKAGEA